VSENASDNPEPLKEGEEFEHVNNCQVASVVWKEGEAHCPTCNQRGTLYSPYEPSEIYAIEKLNISTFISEEDGQRIVLFLSVIGGDPLLTVVETKAVVKALQGWLHELENEQSDTLSSESEREFQ
jgi:hypothetical protein